MALGDESRALLQLLLVRGKDYEAIATLLGIEPGEVRSRAGLAVGELTGEGEALESPLIDYMLGQADPIERAESARLLADRPEQADLYSDARDQLALLFPGANIPAPIGLAEETPDPKAPRGRRERIVPASAEATEKVRTASPEARTRPAMDGKSKTVLAALIAAVGLAGVIAVVLLLGGGGAEQETIEEPPSPTTAVLRPSDGGDGRGEVEFGFAGARFAANVSLSGLEPNVDREGYALWLTGPAGSFPFDSARVGQEGTISGQSEISQAIICFIAADLFTEVKVSRVGDAELTRALRRAVKRNVRQADFPDFVGQTILDGPIAMPIDTRERIIDVCGGRNQAAAGGSPGS